MLLLVFLQEQTSLQIKCWKLFIVVNEISNGKYSVPIPRSYSFTFAWLVFTRFTLGLYTQKTFNDIRLRFTLSIKLMKKIFLTISSKTALNSSKVVLAWTCSRRTTSCGMNHCLNFFRCTSNTSILCSRCEGTSKSRLYCVEIKLSKV